MVIIVNLAWFIDKRLHFDPDCTWASSAFTHCSHPTALILRHRTNLPVKKAAWRQAYPPSTKDCGPTSTGLSKYCEQTPPSTV